MRSDRHFRVFGGCFSGCVAVVIWALIMTALGQRPPPYAYLAPIAAGFAFGYWRAGLMIRQRDAHRRAPSADLPVSVQETR